MPPIYLESKTLCEPANILCCILMQEGQPAVQREHSFLYDIVPSTVGGADGFANIILRNLKRDRPMRLEEFKCTLNLMALLLSWVPEELRCSTDRGILNLLAVLGVAAQRYECYGFVDEDELSERQVAEALKGVLSVHACLTGGISEGAQKLLRSSLAEKDPYCFALVNIFARTAVPVYREEADGPRSVINYLMRRCISISEAGRESYHTDRTSWRKYCYIRRVLQVYWLPTLQKILATLGPSDAPEDLSVAERGSLRGLLKRWKELGRAYNLSERSRDDDTGLTDYVTAAELSLGCHFTECLCYGQKPLHGTRRVCKGCWSVYYCGERCQKKDWKAGHRDICLGRSSTIADGD
ncbi:hypothetical protein BC629DRAFT_8578 [Irpex lacteus]|nr:hypothetical protein BC629DRAFT_8578 [Irpex lacteus]